VKGSHEFLWRTLRNLGVAQADLDDAVQQVFIVASRKLCDIAPGRERAFLFGTAQHVASRCRRTRARQRETLDAELLEDLVGSYDPAEELDRAQARRMLDALLDRLPMEAREVLVLYEIEQLTLAQIADTLDMPLGTVASRLRRARELFVAEVRRAEARKSFEGGRR